jgi:hypothetical protein
MREAREHGMPNLREAWFTAKQVLQSGLFQIILE